eukprot:Pgem_evm1s6696
MSTNFTNYYGIDQGADVVAVLPPHSLTWIFALAMIFAFFDAFGIGANDVANSFATAIASKTLTLVKACCIAGIMEFLGAVLLGSNTTDTVRKKIIDVKKFNSRPDLLMMVMFCSSVGSSIWLILATKLGYPVSTTHSTIGAIMGGGIAAFGFNAVDFGWDGVGQVIASFFISPAIAGFFGALIFLITKYSILIWDNSTKRAIIATPIYAMGTMAIISSFWVYKGTPSLKLDEKPIGVQLGIIFGMTGAVGLLSIFVVVPFLLKRVKVWEEQERKQNEEDSSSLESGTVDNLTNSKNKECDHGLKDEAEVEVAHFNGVEVATGDIDVQENNPEKIDDSLQVVSLEVNGGGSTDSIKKTATTKKESSHSKWKKRHAARKELWDEKTKLERIVWIFSTKNGIMFALDSTILHGIRQDVTHADDQDIGKLHAASFQYKAATEKTFMWLQLMSSAFMAFSHGANDVANAIAPLATSYSIWSNGASGIDVSNGVNKKVEVPIWILVYGGIAINIGLFLMGWRIVYALGNNMTFISPSRGFSMEMGAVVTVLMATFLGIPVSTTHCVTGATIAVGLCEFDYKSINWIQAGKCMFGWIVTLPVTALISGLTFALLTNAPNTNFVGLYQNVNQTTITQF